MYIAIPPGWEAEKWRQEFARTAVQQFVLDPTAIECVLWPSGGGKEQCQCRIKCETRNCWKEGASKTCLITPLISFSVDHNARDASTWNLSTDAQRATYHARMEMNGVIRVIMVQIKTIPWKVENEGLILSSTKCLNQQIRSLCYHRRIVERTTSRKTTADSEYARDCRRSLACSAMRGNWSRKLDHLLVPPTAPIQIRNRGRPKGSGVRSRPRAANSAAIAAGQKRGEGDEDEDEGAATSKE